MPQMYWIIPVEGGGGRPDNSLPGGQGGHPSQPIYHPGHPDHGLPPFPSQGLPGGGQGGRPDNSLPGNQPGIDNALPEGGTEIPSNELPPPAVPPQYEDDLVIGVKPAGSTEWTFTAYDTSNKPDQGLPPHPEPHKRSRR